MLTRRSLLGCLVMVLVIFAAMLGVYRNEQTGQAQPASAPSVVRSPSIRPTVELTVQPTVLAMLPAILGGDRNEEMGQAPSVQPTVELTPTPFVREPLFESDLDLMAGPIDVPLELQIPSLKVNAPVLGVGLTSKNVMDAPKGPIGDPVWHAAYWYRGSGIPGEPGTATIAGHVNDPLGRHEIFADLEDLQPGDLIIVLYTLSNIEIRFIVDQTMVYSIQESSDPAVLAQIFGAGPVAGTGPQPSLDSLSHLTLITCSGNIVNGQFDHHTVVYATRSP
jgi:hypothetical protein